MFPKVKHPVSVITDVRCACSTASGQAARSGFRDRATRLARGSNGDERLFSSGAHGHPHGRNESAAGEAVRIRLSNRQSGAVPRLCLGAEVRLSSALFHPSNARGMARRGGACPGLLTGRSGLLRTGPDRRALTHPREGCARASRRATAASSAFAFYGGRTGPGPVLPRAGFPRRPPGYVSASRARGCRVPPRPCDASRSSAPRRTGRREYSACAPGVKNYFTTSEQCFTICK